MSAPGELLCVRVRDLTVARSHSVRVSLPGMQPEIQRELEHAAPLPQPPHLAPPRRRRTPDAARLAPRLRSSLPRVPLRPQPPVRPRTRPLRPALARPPAHRVLRSRRVRARRRRLRARGVRVPPEKRGRGRRGGGGAARALVARAAAALPRGRVHRAGVRVRVHLDRAAPGLPRVRAAVVAPARRRGRRTGGRVCVRARISGLASLGRFCKW